MWAMREMGTTGRKPWEVGSLSLWTYTGQVFWLMVDGGAEWLEVTVFPSALVIPRCRWRCPYLYKQRYVPDSCRGPACVGIFRKMPC